MHRACVKRWSSDRIRGKKNSGAGRLSLARARRAWSSMFGMYSLHVLSPLDDQLLKQHGWRVWSANTLCSWNGLGGRFPLYTCQVDIHAGVSKHHRTLDIRITARCSIIQTILYISCSLYRRCWFADDMIHTKWNVHTGPAPQSCILLRLVYKQNFTDACQTLHHPNIA